MHGQAREGPGQEVGGGLPLTQQRSSQAASQLWHTPRDYLPLQFRISEFRA